MKRVLLITYYFPPCGGAGVQRWLRLLPYLEENGWSATVLTTSNGDYPVIDESLIQKIPPTVEVVRTKVITLTPLYSALTGSKKLPHGSLESSKSDTLLTKLGYWLRINLIVPDLRRIWNIEAYRTAVKLLRKKKYDIIISTGPPHSTHLICMKLRKKFPIKWITDFRDPWTEINYLQTVKQNSLIKHINRKMEQSVIKNADLNLIISQAIADALPEGNKEVLYNGFEPQDFQSIEYRKADIDNLLKVKYIGVVRKGHPIEEAVEYLNYIAKQNKTGKIELTFVGAFNNVQVPVSENLTIRTIEHTTHRNAIKEMADSDILLLMIRKCPDNKGILTTKLFEYIASGRYIIGIGPADGEAALVLRESGAGVMVDYNDKERFQQAFNEAFKKDRKRQLSKNSFSAPQQAKRLSAMMDKLIGTDS